MIRAVLVGWSEGDWRLYRQPQWMAEVRRAPELTGLSRHYYDVDEKAIRAVLDSWERDGASSSLDAAMSLLGRYGAVEIIRP